MEESYVESELYLLKKGEILHMKDLFFHEKFDLQEKERDLPFSLNIEVEQVTKYLADGYSIIKLVEDVAFWKKEQKRKKLKVFLNRVLDPRDYYNIIHAIQEIEQNEILSEELLYNFTEGRYRDNYDYWNSFERCDPYRYQHMEESDFIKVVDLYTREKMDCLSEKEQMMFEVYRGFDLKQITTEDVTSHYIIHSTNAGIIIVTKNEIHEMSLRKGIHDREFISIEGALHPEIQVASFIPESFPDITILLYLYHVVFYIPIPLSTFQITYLEGLLNLLNGLNQEQQLKEEPFVHISGRTYGEKRRYFDSVQEFDQILKQLKISKKN